MNQIHTAHSAENLKYFKAAMAQQSNKNDAKFGSFMVCNLWTQFLLLL
jgi:hypothetical protein